VDPGADFNFTHDCRCWKEERRFKLEVARMVWATGAAAGKAYTRVTNTAAGPWALGGALPDGFKEILSLDHITTERTDFEVLRVLGAYHPPSTPTSHRRIDARDIHTSCSGG
jgi:hypothetical protein